MQILIFILFIVIIVAAILGIIQKFPCGSWIFNRAAIKGKTGERNVSRILSQLPPEYRIFNDIYIQTENNLTQIDHVVVSPYGIFCIETKNYKGWISGGNNSDQWTKSLYGRKYRFNNPLKQNFSHVKALSSYLNLSTKYIIPIVVFLHEARLMNQTNGNVIYSGQLLQFIRSYMAIVHTNENLQNYIYKLSNTSVIDEQTKQRHLLNVQQKIVQKNFKLANGVCPTCGGKLIERQGRFGYFYGCSNYPKCKYTHKL